VRLVGYLQALSDKLLIDLVAVSSFAVAGSTILVPQRVDPERRTAETAAAPPRPAPQGKESEGAGEFLAAIERAPEQHRARLRRLSDWAQGLEREGLVKLSSYEGKEKWTLLPRLPAEKVGLVTIWNDNGAYLSLWRSVFERRAPSALGRVEQLIAPKPLGQGSTVSQFDDALLAALADAYREAAEQSRA
jgi:hypothetical protein